MSASRGWQDISLPIEPQSIAWSGLAKPSLTQLADIRSGDAVTVGQLDCCLHTGTHADAPLHVDAKGKAVHQLDPAAFVGPASLLRIESEAAISAAELKARGIESLRGKPEGDRVLLQTPCQYDGQRFPQSIPHLEAEAAELLAWLGVRLVGVNLPSIDPLDSQAMQAHRLVFSAGACVLENLDLRGVEPGRYELVGPPIRIEQADAAPVRALIRALD